MQKHFEIRVMHCSFAVVVLLCGSKQCPSFAGEIVFSERVACCPGGLRLMDFQPTLHFFVSAKQCHNMYGGWLLIHLQSFEFNPTAKSGAKGGCMKHLKGTMRCKIHLAGRVEYNFTA